MVHGNTVYEVIFLYTSSTDLVDVYFMLLTSSSYLHCTVINLMPVLTPDTVFADLFHFYLLLCDLSSFLTCCSNESLIFVVLFSLGSLGLGNTERKLDYLGRKAIMIRTQNIA